MSVMPASITVSNGLLVLQISIEAACVYWISSGGGKRIFAESWPLMRGPRQILSRQICTSLETTSSRLTTCSER